MIWRGDARWSKGLEQHGFVELADFAPTLLGAAGVQHGDAGMDGISYLPLLHDRPHPAGRDHAYVESYSGAPQDPTPPPQCWPRTIRTGDFRCTFYADPRMGELYDLKNDPDEQDNLFFSSRFSGVVEDHRRRLLTRLILMDHPLPA